MLELLTIHVGQYGVQAGNALWELLACEHGINCQGQLISTTKSWSQPCTKSDDIGVFFHEESCGNYSPRAIMVDLEPIVIDEVRKGAYRRLFKLQYLLSGKEDASNNYARGYINLGRHMCCCVMEEIRLAAECCDKLCGFSLFHSFAGGTGSGLTALLTEALRGEYCKKVIFANSLFPSCVHSTTTVDPYNTVLAIKATANIQDCSILMDNKALNDRASKQLDVPDPTYTTLNRIIAHLYSSLYLTHRYSFVGTQHCGLTDLVTNIVPYPRIHYPVLAGCPLISESGQHHQVASVPAMTNTVFTEDAATLDCKINCGGIISAAMLYRGDIHLREVSRVLYELKREHRMDFVEWCPTMFKVGLARIPSVTVKTSRQAVSPKTLCMLAGHVAVGDVFQSVVSKFDRLFERFAFVHWYVCEGLEEAELTEARDEVCSLASEYADLIDESAAESGRTSDLRGPNGSMQLIQESAASQGAPRQPSISINMSNARLRGPERPVVVIRGMRRQQRRQVGRNPPPPPQIPAPIEDYGDSGFFFGSSNQSYSGEMDYPVSWSHWPREQFFQIPYPR